MVKDTCLIALKRKEQSPHILGLEILLYFILEAFIRRFQNESTQCSIIQSNNAIIIRIGIA
jgi:hypothetical protein